MFSASGGRCVYYDVGMDGAMLVLVKMSNCLVEKLVFEHLLFRQSINVNLEDHNRNLCK